MPKAKILSNFIIRGAKKPKIEHPPSLDLTSEIPDDDGFDLMVKDIIINTCASSSAVPNSELQDKYAKIGNRIQILFDKEKNLLQRRMEVEKMRMDVEKRRIEVEKDAIDCEASLNVIQMDIKKLNSHLGDICNI